MELITLTPADPRYPTALTSAYRNRVVAALAARVFVAYAAPNGKTEQFCREIADWRKPLITFDDNANADLSALGAQTNLQTSKIL